VSHSFVRAFSLPFRFATILDNALFPALSSMFTHGAWQHLLTNAVVLWLFGGTEERLLGKAGFLVFYLACGVGSVLVHVAAEPNLNVPLLGASGAISGVLGAYVAAHPRGRIRACLLRRCIECPALAIIVLYLFGGLLMEAALMMVPGTYRLTRVGYVLHGGGFVVGMLLMAAFRKRVGQ
jgi:membrane associated rhomboid family serine protease